MKKAISSILDFLALAFAWAFLTPGIALVFLVLAFLSPFCVAIALAEMYDEFKKKERK